MNCYTARFCFAASLWLVAGLTHADIYRWDNGEVIPGTEGITPGPGVQLVNLDLSYGDFSRLIGSDLSRATFAGSNLTRARFSRQVLFQADFTDANIDGVDFTGTTPQSFLARPDGRN